MERTEMQEYDRQQSCSHTTKLSPKSPSKDDKYSINIGCDSQESYSSSSTADKYSVNISGEMKKHKKPVRKRLGSRRMLKDMITPEEQKISERDDDRQQMSRQQFRPPRRSKPKRRLVFTSPRLISSDEDLFPFDHSVYRESNQRWQQISDQAGCHRQDGTVMNIGKRPSTPTAYRIGMVECAAIRVRSLNLWLDHEKDTLSDWLDMISEVFVNLEHLTLTEDIFPGEDDMAVSARMRRLYVLSMLPNLKSIDDMAITLKERKMTNPKGYCENKQSKRHFANSSNNKSINKGVDHKMSRVVMVPASVGSDEIEVEMLVTELKDMKFMETGTTECTSPTVNSERTISVIDSNDELSENKGRHVRLLDVNNTYTEDLDKCSNNSIIQRVRTALTKHEDTVMVHKQAEDDTGGGYLGSAKKEFLKNDCHIISTNIGNRSTINDDEIREGIARGRVRTIHDDSNDTIELISVPSNDVEWSGVCGVLTFRREKSCAPEIRPPFSSRDVKRRDSTNQAYQTAVANLRKKGREKKKYCLKSCTPVQRQSMVVVPTPQVGCCQILIGGAESTNKFSFPARRSQPVTRNMKPIEQSSDCIISANKQLPPSKSLSSPFPMQFRERQKPANSIVVAQLQVKTSESMDSDSERTQSICGSRDIIDTGTIVGTLSVVSPTASSANGLNQNIKQGNKGELPPKCPSRGLRGQGPTDHSSKMRKQKRLHPRKLNEASKETARSMSVMDLDDEEDFLEENEENTEVEPMNGSSRILVDAIA